MSDEGEGKKEPAIGWLDHGVGGYYCGPVEEGLRQRSERYTGPYRRRAEDAPPRPAVTGRPWRDLAAEGLVSRAEQWQLRRERGDTPAMQLFARLVGLSRSLSAHPIDLRSERLSFRAFPPQVQEAMAEIRAVMRWPSLTVDDDFQRAALRLEVRDLDGYHGGLTDYELWLSHELLHETYRRACIARDFPRYREFEEMHFEYRHGG